MKASDRWFYLALIVVGLIFDVNPLTLVLGIPVTAGGIYFFFKSRHKR